jgi:hypothetical protein
LFDCFSLDFVRVGHYLGPVHEFLDPEHEEDLGEGEETLGWADEEDDPLDPAWSLVAEWQPAAAVFGRGLDGLPQPDGRRPELEMAATHENLVCLAGCGLPVCRHFRRVVTEFPAGNKGDDNRHPIIKRYCEKLAIHNEPMEISVVTACEYRMPSCRKHGIKAVEKIEEQFAAAFPDSKNPVIRTWSPPKRAGVFAWLRQILSRVFSTKQKNKTG